MNWHDFHFIRPFCLLAFIPAMAVLWVMQRNKAQSSNWLAVCDAELLPYLIQDKFALDQKRISLMVISYLVVLLSVLALAGPTWERLPTPAYRNYSALVIALELSRSMDAGDISPSRLIRARYKIADLLKLRKDGQTALLVYAGDAFVVTPLTTDTATIASQLPALTTDIMPGEGNNTADALEKAFNLFQQAGLQTGQIILLADNVDLQKAERVAEEIAEKNFKISVLAIGTEEGAPIASTNGGFVKNEQGAILLPKLNATGLRQLAKTGAGNYQSVTANDSDIKSLLTITPQPNLQQSSEEPKLTLQKWDDKGPWVVLVIVPLAALFFRKGLLCWTLLALLPLPKNSFAFEWQDIWQTKDQQAQSAYKHQQYDKAAELFSNPNWKAVAQYKAGNYEKSQAILKASESALNAYNLGNALAQSGKLPEALAAYQKALAIAPNDEDTKYNKSLVEKEIQKQQQDSKNQKQDKSQDNKQSNQKPSNQEQNSQPSQNSNDQKPESKPEKPSASEKSGQVTGKSKSAAEKQQSETQEKNNQDPSVKPEAEEKNKQIHTSPTEEQKTSNEQEKANEQWLKRIPDDPTSLLKRKFKYQYNQRNRS